MRSQFFLGVILAGLAFVFSLSVYRLATGSHVVTLPPTPVIDKLEEGVLRGRVVFPDGTPFPYGLERGALVFTARTSHPEQPKISFEYEVLEDGRFAVRPRAEAGRSIELSQLQDFCVLFVPEGVREETVLESLPVQHSLMSRIDPRDLLASGESELGEIVLGNLPPLMCLRVVNADGEPIHRAEVFLEYFLPGRTMSGKWPRRSSPPKQFTNADGEVYLTGRDWADSFSYQPLGRGFPDAKFESIRVRLNHTDYAPIYVELETDQFEHELEMPAAGILVCEIANRPVMEELRIGVVRPGEALHPVAWGLFSRKLRSNRSSFLVHSMLAGEVDVLITGHIGDRELLRIPNVQIPVNGESSDPRLMGIDFEQALDWLELELTWPDGLAIMPEECEDWSPTVRYQFKNGVWSIPCQIVDGWIRLPMARGETLNAWIELQGARPILVSNEGAGRRQAIVRPSLVLEWRFEGVDQIPPSVDWSMQLHAPAELVWIRQVGPYPDDRWTAALPEPGEYTLEWIATLEGDTRRSVRFVSTETWTEEELTKGHMHQIPLPAAFVERIRQTFESE